MLLLCYRAMLFATLAPFFRHKQDSLFHHVGVFDFFK